MELELKDVGFLHSPLPDKRPVARRRKAVEGGRPGLVATRLTAGQLGKLDELVGAYTKQSGFDFSRAAVLALLIDKA